MKSFSWKITSLMVVVLLSTAAVYAQYGSHVILKVDIPFEFNVGNKVLPAGSYQVVRVGSQMLTLRDADNKLFATIVTSPIVETNMRSAAVLKFRVDGDRYWLSQIWTGVGKSGYELSVPKRVTYLAEQKPVEVQASSGKR